MSSSGTTETTYGGTATNGQGSAGEPFGAKDWQLIGLLALIASLMFLPCLGSAGLFDPTDSFFIESGREMFETNNLIVPLMNYEPWLDKPALAFWFIVQSFKTFGVNEFAGRFPSALSGILIVLSTFVLTRQLLGRRQAFLSALTLTASPLFLIVGHVALTDEPLALFLTISLLSIINFIVRKKTLFLLIGYFSLAMAALCKGPLALVIVGLITLGYLVLTAPRKILSSILSLKPLLALAFLLVVTVPYYVWAHIGTDGQFTNAFFLRQNLGRMVGVVNHVNPFWWYIPVVLGGFFPWSLILLSSKSFLIKCFKLRGKLFTPRQKLAFFSICWATIGFLFFSAIPTKLQTYIVPIFPALAIVTGIYLDVLLRLRRTTAFIVSTISLLIISCGAPFFVYFLNDHTDVVRQPVHGSSYVSHVGSTQAALETLGNQFHSAFPVPSANPQSANSQSTDPQAKNPQSGNSQSTNPRATNPQSTNPQSTMKAPQGPGFMSLVGYGTAVVLVLGLLVSVIANRGNSCRLLSTIYSGTMIGCGVFLPLLFCLYHDKYQANIDNAVTYCLSSGAHLAAVQFEYPSLMYRYHQKIPLLKNQEDLQAYSDQPGKRWIFIPEEVLSLLSWTKRSPRVVGYSGKYWIFAIGKDALTEDTIEWNGLLPQFHYPTIAELKLKAQNNSAAP